VIVTDDPSTILPLEAGSHVCWIVNSDARYVDHTLAILDDGKPVGEKRVVFGADGSEALASLAPFADIAVDPGAAFLDGGPVVPERMFSMFEEQIRLARSEGFSGIRLVADMDWVVATGASAGDILAFELQLDRVVAELGATVVCAYRRGTFDHDVISGQLCVHPVVLGEGEPPFRFVARDDRAWRLTGEVDLLAGDVFSDIFKVAAGDDVCVVDASELGFIDLGGMRAIAEAAAPGRRIVIEGAPSVLARCWSLAGFDELAPTVEITT
jgi:hypothetical protein